LQKHPRWRALLVMQTGRGLFARQCVDLVRIENDVHRGGSQADGSAATKQENPPEEPSSLN
jgi:hypothetical protein